MLLAVVLEWVGGQVGRSVNGGGNNRCLLYVDKDLLRS